MEERKTSTDVCRLLGIDHGKLAQLVIQCNIQATHENSKIYFSPEAVRRIQTCLDIEKNQPLPKVSFYRLATVYALNDEKIFALSGMSGVPPNTIKGIILGGMAIARKDAEAVLAALSELVGATWTLAHVQIPLRENLP